MQAQILAPGAVLIVWSLVVLFWIVAVRFPAMAALRHSAGSGGGVGLGAAKPGGRGQDLEGRIPDRAVWPAHNYTHLMEQPTLFYAAIVILALTGADRADVVAAWLYVGLRVVHSLWQGLVNTLPVRFALFLASSLALIFLAARAVMQTLFATGGAPL